MSATNSSGSCSRSPQAGGRIYYFRSNATAGIHDRYTYQHGKFWVLDGSKALIGSENLNLEAFPDDPKADGTFGRRGVYLVTDAPSVVAELTAIMDADIAPGVHRDVWAWDPADPTLGAPPAGFVPSYDSGGNSYPVQKPAPLVTQGAFTFQLIHSPEQALRDQDSLLGLVNRAGAGDTILVEQLYENLYWGIYKQQRHRRSQSAPGGLHRRGRAAGQRCACCSTPSSTTRT